MGQDKLTVGIKRMTKQQVYQVFYRRFLPGDSISRGYRLSLVFAMNITETWLNEMWHDFQEIGHQGNE